VKNLGRLGSGGAGDSGLEKQSFPRALPDTLDRILGKLLLLFFALRFWTGPVLCGSALVSISVADPDPPDPYVFGPPGSGSISQRYGSGSGFFYHQAKILK
jgi:hypothetical protein